jgi:uncharacterized protein YbjT (DUF2867 family)
LARSCHIRSIYPVLKYVTTSVLVIGGTGTLGSVVVDRLLAAGADVRVLSRGRRRRRSDVEHLIGDARSGAGLDRAFADADVVVMCAEHAPEVAAAATRAGIAHLLYTSIVGIDRIPFFFYRRKLRDERLIAASGVPWTVLRATQFHDLIAVIMRMLAKSPVVTLPAGLRFQPVDVRDVGARLATLALGEPAGRAPDFGGPEVRTVKDLAHTYLSMAGKRRAMVPIWLPGKAFRAFRHGENLTPDNAAGTITFEQYLTEQFAAGHLAYADAIHDYLRRTRKGMR